MKPSILICDDEKFFADLYRLEMESHGAEVIVVGNGKDALEMIKQRKFDLILLDLLMPIMGGLEVLAALKKDRTRIPVTFVLTNLSQNIDKAKCKELGAEEYIIKADMDAPEIWEKIKVYLPHYETN